MFFPACCDRLAAGFFLKFTLQSHHNLIECMKEGEVECERAYDMAVT